MGLAPSGGAWGQPMGVLALEEHNLRLLRSLHQPVPGGSPPCPVLTKDGGAPGGLPPKLYDLNIGLGNPGQPWSTCLGLGLSEDKCLPATGLLKGDKLMNWIHELVGSAL